MGWWCSFPLHAKQPSKNCCCHKTFYEVFFGVLESNTNVYSTAVINNPKLAEDEGDSEWAMSLLIQKLFCSALKQNSDTVGGENQSSQPREKNWEVWEALITVMDLSQLCEKPLHTSAVLFIKSEMHLHLVTLVAAWKKKKMAKGTVPLDFWQIWHFDE